MRVARGENKAPQTLKLRVPHYLVHQASGEPPSAVSLENVYVGQIGERCFVRNHSSESHLLAAEEDTKAEGIRNGAFDDVSWNSRRPISLREKCMDGVNVKSRGVGGDLVGRHSVDTPERRD